MARSDQHRPLSRRVWALALAVALWVTATPCTAQGASVSQLKARLESVQQRYEQAGAKVDQAFDKLDETDARIEHTQLLRAKALRELRASQKVLAKRAERMYRGGSVGAIAMLVGSVSFDDFVTRLDYLRRIGVQDARAVAMVKDRRAKLTAQEKALKSQRQARLSDLQQVKERRQTLENDLQSTKSEYEDARLALAAARAKAAADAAVPSAGSNHGVTVAPGSNGMVFPVAGPNYYSDTFGAPRSGGRTHQGTDIMASTGIPVVAVTSGYVSSKEGGLGGKTIWLSGSSWDFYYAHLSGWAVTSGHVSAGQVIGYVGATGNASGGAPHLHFEMHPGGGSAVNPYPYLRAMQ